MSYSPDRRTALILSGTGAHGAYLAGAVRALQEAGVKVDVVAGQGIGAAIAALAAIDGAARLWDTDGIWRSATARKLYAWKGALRSAAWLIGVLAIVLLTPLLVLACGFILYAIGFFLEMLGNATGGSLMAAYSQWVQHAFTGENLPALISRLATLILALIVLVLLAGALVARWRGPGKRRAAGAWWWRVAGAPLDAEAARDLFAQTIWRLIRSAAAADGPTASAVGRRYSEVLSENLGQPGFRELMMVATDLDARRDVVAALLREPYRREFIAARPGRERRSEALDLGGADKEHALDVVAAALTPPLVCEPHVIAYAADSFWRGEAHRLCDRPGSVIRLLEELSAAGVAQAIIVTAVAAGLRPHRLASARLDLRSRLGEFITGSESAALDDASETARMQFDAVYLIGPAHNPVGPFDVAGAYDEASDRRQDVVELMERGYEDARRQFVEPVVGASGEHLVRPAPGAFEVSGGHAHGDRLFDKSDSPR